MKRLISFVLLLIPMMGLAQNLVPNPSFEDHTNCPLGPGAIWSAQPWYSARGTVDYYNACSTNQYNVPNAQGGGGVANSGEAYAGLGVYVPHSATSREFAEVELTTQLISGKKYQVEFYVSLVDSCWYAINSLGACLTPHGIGNNLDSIFTLTPQIQNPDTFFLAAKDKWMKVEGSFYANGTERFIAIGNFKNNNNTDTILVHQSSNWVQAHYYLDDVSVTLDTTTGINEEELAEIEFTLYPNPNDGNMYLEYRNLVEGAMFELYDVTGRKISSYNLTSENGKLSITERGLSNGVYMYRIVNDKYKYTFGKIVIRK